MFHAPSAEHALFSFDNEAIRAGHAGVNGRVADNGLPANEVDRAGVDDYWWRIKELDARTKSWPPWTTS
jgi:hypothetical protein